MNFLEAFTKLDSLQEDTLFEGELGDYKKPVLAKLVPLEVSGLIKLSKPTNTPADIIVEVVNSKRKYIIRFEEGENKIVRFKNRPVAFTGDGVIMNGTIYSITVPAASVAGHRIGKAFTDHYVKDTRMNYTGEFSIWDCQAEHLISNDLDQFIDLINKGKI